jgi:predicted nucleic acid-binding Zn ribbon protein
VSPPARRRREPQPAASVLARFRRRAGGGAAGTGAPGAAVAAAALAWPDVVGRAAADHSVPVRRSRAGVLTVACSSASWAMELSARRAELAPRLARLCPDAGVTALRFAVADHVLPPPAPQPDPVSPPRAAPGPAEREAGTAAAAGVREPALRDLVARAAAASAARRRSP